MVLLQTHPDLQIILYISGSGGLLERMAACNPDIMSIDQHVDMRDAIQRIGPKFAVQVSPPPWQCTIGMQKRLAAAVAMLASHWRSILGIEGRLTGQPVNGPRAAQLTDVE